MAAKMEPDTGMKHLWNSEFPQISQDPIQRILKISLQQNIWSLTEDHTLLPEYHLKQIVFPETSGSSRCKT